MIARLAFLLASLVATWWSPAFAAAQDEALPPAVFEGEAAPAPSDDDWVAPKILVVVERRTPESLVREVTDLLEPIGEVANGDEFVREARARGLPPTSDAAFEALLPDAGIALVVTLGVSTDGPEPLLVVGYREGGLGLTLLEEDHPLAGDRLRAGASERIVAEARLALAAITRPRPSASSAGGTPVVSPSDAAAAAEDRDVEPGAAVHVGLAAGFGFGMRRFEVPVPLGIVRLTTDPFPAASIRLALDLEPRAQGQLSLGVELGYVTSVGLMSTDMRVDGTTRETPSRSQRFDVWLGGAYRLGEALSSPSLGAVLGYGLRSFESEAPVTLPDYALSGFTLQLRFALPLLEGRIVVMVAPEVAWIAFVDGSLTEQGVGSSAVALGIEARVRVGIAGPFHAELSFRESHAILSSDAGESRDVERYLTLGIAYRP